MNYNFIRPDLIVGSCPQVFLFQLWIPDSIMSNLVWSSDFYFFFLKLPDSWWCWEVA